MTTPFTAKAARQRILAAHMNAAQDGLQQLSYNVKSPNLGVAGDGQYVTDGVATVGSTTLTSATADFDSDDVGKLMVIEGGAVTGYPFVTTIATVVSATTVTLTAAPTRSQSSAGLKWGTDDTALIRAAITAARTDKVPLFFPPALYMITDDLALDSNDVWLGVPGRSVIVAGASFAGAMLTDNGSVVSHPTLYGLTLDGAGLAAKCAAFDNGIAYSSTPYISPYQTIGGEIAFCNFIGWTDTGFSCGAHGGAKLYMHDCRVRGFIGPTGGVVALCGMNIDQSDSWFENIYVNAFTQFGIRDRAGVNWWNKLHIDGGYGYGISFENADHHLTDSEIDMSNVTNAIPVKLAGLGQYYISNCDLRSGSHAGDCIFWFSNDGGGAAADTHTYIEIIGNRCAGIGGSSPKLVSGEAGQQIKYARIAHNHNISVTTFNQTETHGTLSMGLNATSVSGSVPVIGDGVVNISPGGDLGTLYYTFSPGAAGAAGTLQVDCSDNTHAAIPVSYWIRTCQGATAYAVA